MKEKLYDWCETCGRLIGGKYDDQNTCCMKTLIAEEEEALVAAPLEEVEEAVEEEDGEDFEAYLEELPVKELKKLCKKADLDTKGKKADLIARLIE
jgi:hypothetical protein